MLQTHCHLIWDEILFISKKPSSGFISSLSLTTKKKKNYRWLCNLSICSTQLFMFSWLWALKHRVHNVRWSFSCLVLLSYGRLCIIASCADWFTLMVNCFLVNRIVCVCSPSSARKLSAQPQPSRPGPGWRKWGWRRIGWHPSLPLGSQLQRKRRRDLMSLANRTSPLRLVKAHKKHHDLFCPKSNLIKRSDASSIVKLCFMTLLKRWTMCVLRKH